MALTYDRSDRLALDRSDRLALDRSVGGGGAMEEGSGVLKWLLEDIWKFEMDVPFLKKNNNSQIGNFCVTL